MQKKRDAFDHVELTQLEYTQQPMSLIAFQFINNGQVDEEDRTALSYLIVKRTSTIIKSVTQALEQLNTTTINLKLSLTDAQVVEYF